MPTANLTNKQKINPVLFYSMESYKAKMTKPAVGTVSPKVVFNTIKS